PKHTPCCRSGFAVHKPRFTKERVRGIVRALGTAPRRHIRAMKVAILKERRADERRVAASPDTVKAMVGMGLEPVVESGAGAGACFPDDLYTAAGANIVAAPAAALAAAEIVLKVQRPMRG